MRTCGRGAGKRASPAAAARAPAWRLGSAAQARRHTAASPPASAPHPCPHPWRQPAAARRRRRPRRRHQASPPQAAPLPPPAAGAAAGLASRARAAGACRAWLRGHAGAWGAQPSEGGVPASCWLGAKVPRALLLFNVRRSPPGVSAGVQAMRGASCELRAKCERRELLSPMQNRPRWPQLPFQLHSSSDQLSIHCSLPREQPPGQLCTAPRLLPRPNPSARLPTRS